MKKKKKEKVPGEKRNEFVTVSGEGTLDSVSDTRKSGKFRRLRHGIGNGNEVVIFHSQFLEFVRLVSSCSSFHR
jgi:hypothetical protein